jgi:hypothetical protein
MCTVRAVSARAAATDGSIAVDERAVDTRLSLPIVESSCVGACEGTRTTRCEGRI